MTQTRLTPIAVMSGSPNPSVRRGTMRIPPPSPRSDPNRPAATPPPTSRRTITTSAGRSVVRPFGPALGAKVLRCVRQEGDDPGSLEGDRQLALVGRAGPRLAAGVHLRPLPHGAPGPLPFPFIDPPRLVGAAGADIPTPALPVVVVSCLRSR